MKHIRLLATRCHAGGPTSYRGSPRGRQMCPRGWPWARSGAAWPCDGTCIIVYTHDHVRIELAADPNKFPLASVRAPPLRACPPSLKGVVGGTRANAVPAQTPILPPKLMKYAASAVDHFHKLFVEHYAKAARGDTPYKP